MILLTDEEILALEQGSIIHPGDVAKAQLKKVVEFIDYYESTMQHALDDHTRFDIPTEKWQALLEEVK